MRESHEDKENFVAAELLRLGSDDNSIWILDPLLRSSKRDIF